MNANWPLIFKGNVQGFPRLDAQERAVVSNPARQGVRQRRSLILYPSLRVEFPNAERKIVGDLPPRAFCPLSVKVKDLQIESDFHPNLAAKSHRLTKLRAKSAIGTLKQGGGLYPLAVRVSN